MSCQPQMVGQKRCYRGIDKSDAGGHVQSYGINGTWKTIENLATHNKLIIKAEEK